MVKESYESQSAPAYHQQEPKSKPPTLTDRHQCKYEKNYTPTGECSVCLLCKQTLMKRQLHGTKLQRAEKKNRKKRKERKATQLPRLLHNTQSWCYGDLTCDSPLRLLSLNVRKITAICLCQYATTLDDPRRSDMMKQLFRELNKRCIPSF